MLEQHIGPIVEELANLYSGISVTHPIEAEAVLSGRRALKTEGGANIRLEDGRAIVMGQSSPDDGVVLEVNLISDREDVYVHTPIVEIEGPGIVTANAIPVITDTTITGGIIDRSGGLYTAERRLVTEIAQPIVTDDPTRSIIVEDPSRLAPRRRIVIDDNYNILTEMGFRILDENERAIRINPTNPNLVSEKGLVIIEDGPDLILPVTVEGDGTGAVVNALATFEGKVIAIEVVSPGSGYTHASFVFPRPVRRIPPARAKPIVVGNRLVAIEVEFGSWNYLFNPRVTITDAGLGFRTNVTTAFDHLIGWTNLLPLPAICVYPGPFYKFKGKNNPDLLKMNIRLYGNPNLEEMDDFIEDVDILTDIYYKKSTLPIEDSRITHIGSFGDYWFPKFTMCDMEAEIWVNKNG